MNILEGSIFLVAVGILALGSGCTKTPEPIQDYDAPLGKYEVARPAVEAAVIEANDEWINCPQWTPSWPNGSYPINADPRPYCRDSGAERVSFTPPTHQPPTSKPPTSKPPTQKPPTSKPPETEARVKRNNGLGDGDNPAPGRSLARNRAENQSGSSVHRSGKPQVPN